MPPSLLKHLLLAAVGASLCGLVVAFVWRFVRSALHLSSELETAIAALKALHDRTRGHIADLDQIADSAMSGAALSPAWREYAKTLHPQRALSSNGQYLIERWRATALAESFFTDQAIVETRLRSEFFKHVPGILTGLGIIGTFSGLIVGLGQFKVDGPPDQAQAELKKLLDSVGEAFVVSACAIGFAMLLTASEKLLMARRYGQLEELRGILDSFFEPGVGEEYLERLVKATEISATQAAQIKDALVADLKEILTSLTTQQIHAQATNFSQISSDVGRAISDSLAPSMERITRAVDGVTTNQGDAVNRMLTDVLANFAAQVEKSFGGQMEGMTKLLTQTSESMQLTAAQFTQLADNMNTAGSNAVDAMGARLGTALQALDARQSAMNLQMAAFVEQIRNLVSESQSQSARRLQEALGSVGEQVAGVVAELQRQAELAADSHADRQHRLEESTGAALGSISSQVESLLAQSAETNRSLQHSVSRLTEATNLTVAGLSESANTLYIAASDFSKAGTTVSATMASTSDVVKTINAATAHLSTASAAMKAVVEDNSAARAALAAIVADLKLTIENGKRDAAMTSEFIRRIEAATAKLATAQRQSEEYLAGISGVLTEAHKAFAQSIEKTMRDSNRKFHDELAGSVGLLSGTIKDLESCLDNIPLKKA